MCGIYGVTGAENGVGRCLEGLSRLEYRGYDSAGLVGFEMAKGFMHVKAVGKLNNLKAKCGGLAMQTAMAHTRWATHGEPSESNAHPHFDQSGKVAVIHNGIIENHNQLRLSLSHNYAATFASSTDTEVIAQLIGFSSKEALVDKVCDAHRSMEGAWACVVLHKDHPGTLVAFSRSCPLVVARDNVTQEVSVASDINAFQDGDLEVAYLSDDEVVLITPGRVQFFDVSGNPIERTLQAVSSKSSLISKGQFDHYMLKEIYEQPETIYAALRDRIVDGNVHLPELDKLDLASIDRIIILACGTSYHAGCIAARLFEDAARIPTVASIASEFRYQNPIIDRSTLVIAISQSGETADTIAALREAKQRGATVIGICNAERSLLVREAHAAVFLRAGPEISVCSTKAFTSQLTVLALLTHLLAVRGGYDCQIASLLGQLPGLVNAVIYRVKQIESIACRFTQVEHFFYIGRQSMYVAAMEGALKLKEIAYVDANAYAAGEMKHGPISLLSPELPVVVFGCHRQTAEKLYSNVQECKARRAPIVSFGFEDDKELEQLSDHFIPLPACSDLLAPIPVSVAGQLFAYFIARARGCDIDQPRNLAKSVTVE